MPTSHNGIALDLKSRPSGASQFDSGCGRISQNRTFDLLFRVHPFSCRTKCIFLLILYNKGEMNKLIFCRMGRKINYFSAIITFIGQFKWYLFPILFTPSISSAPFKHSSGVVFVIA